MTWIILYFNMKVYFNFTVRILIGHTMTLIRELLNYISNSSWNWFPTFYIMEVTYIIKKNEELM